MSTLSPGGVAGPEPPGPRDITEGDTSVEPPVTDIYTPIDDRTPLHRFLEEQTVENYDALGLSQLLPNAINDIDTPSEMRYGRTPLHIAVERNLTKAVKQLLDAGASVSVATNDRQYPLHYACDDQNLEIVGLLLDRNPESNARDSDGYTPLINVCVAGNAEIAGLLLSHDADTQATDDEGWSPLYFACRHGHKDVVEVLIDRDESNIDTPNDLLETPLHAAAEIGHDETVRYLLNKGADATIRDIDGNTPLMTASMFGFDACVDILVNHIFEPMQQDTPKMAALMDACEKGQLDIATKLVNRGGLPYINSQDEFGESALLMASSYGHRDVAELLLSKMATLDLENQHRQNALHKASSQGYASIVQLLIDKDMRTDTTDDQGKTALHHACEANCKGQEDLYIADAQLDVEITAPRTENISSAPGQYCQVIIILLRGGANPDLQTQDGKTALHLAVDHDDTKRVEILLKKQKSRCCTVKDDKGRTALYVAFEKLRLQTMRVLLRKMRYADKQEAINWAAEREQTHYIAKTLLIESNTSPSGTSPEGSGSWGVIEWAAHREMPRVLWLLLSTSPTTSNTNESRERALECTKARIQRIEDQGTELGGTRDRGKDKDRRQGIQGQEGTLRSKITLVRDILQDPPFTQTSTPKEAFKISNIQGTSRPVETTRMFRAAIVEFYDNEAGSGFLRRFRNVDEVIYEKGPRKILDDAKKGLQEIVDGKLRFPSQSLNEASILPKMYTTSEPSFTWVHLEATNMSWMNDLLKRTALEQKYKEEDFSKLNSFFQDSWVEIPDQKSKSRFMRPQCVTHSENKNWKAIYMPYLTFSKELSRDHSLERANEEDQERNDPIIQTMKQGIKKTNDLLNVYEGRAVHGSPTLDESYYHFTADAKSQKDQQDRNRSQVVTNTLPHDKKSTYWTLLRVDQLWTWVFDDQLITSTTHPVDKEEGLLLTEVFDYLGKRIEAGGSYAQPRSPLEMSKILVDYCIGFYERQQLDGINQSIRQIFSKSINENAIEEMRLYQKFQLQKSETKYKRKSTDEMNKIIRSAATLSCNIKDIRDELNMLMAIAGYQRRVQNSLNKGKAIDDSRSATYIVDDIKEMDKAANRIHSSVDTLISLEQNETANFQAEEGVKQSQTLMTFTVITIVFKWFKRIRSRIANIAWKLLIWFAKTEYGEKLIFENREHKSDSLPPNEPITEAVGGISESRGINSLLNWLCLRKRKQPTDGETGQAPGGVP